MAGVASTQESPFTGTEAFRVPPHSLEAEQSVLGGLMLSKTAWDMVADKITLVTRELEDLFPEEVQHFFKY